MPLVVYQSNTLERLMEPFTGIISSGNRPVLSPDHILVQSIGMGRYFVTGAARLTGVCANFTFIYPQQFFTMLCSRYGIPCETTDKQTLAWSVYRLIRAAPDSLSPEMAEYARNADELKLYKLSLAIADTFDQYTMYRSDMTLRWDQGDPVLVSGGQISDLDTSFRWQYELWNVLKEEGVSHRAMIRTRLLAAVRESSAVPFPHLCAIGLSNLPPFYMELLSALAEKTDIFLLLLNPSPRYWYDIVSERTVIQQEIIKEYNSQGGDLYYYLGNPLLSLFGMQGRDFYTLLIESGTDVSDDTYFHEPSPSTLLGQIQHDIYSLTDRTEFSSGDVPRFSCAGGDLSLTIHGCHNRMRQLEVVHDQILALFDELPGLVPGEILVMTPKIAEYEPYITAVFSNRNADGSPLPFTIADLAVTTYNHIAETLLSILSLESERLTVSMALDILECDEVCAAFSIPVSERSEVVEWLKSSSFRWGIDEHDRETHSGVSFDTYSLKRSLLRICAGVSFGEDETYEGVSPAVDLGTGMLETAGALMEYLDALSRYARLFRQERTVAGWITLLYDCIQTFFNPAGVSSDDQALLELYDAVAQVSLPDNDGMTVPFSIIRHMMTTELSRVKKEFGFIDGRITFCEMLPMRSIPFRVIIMVGMDEGAFPRSMTPLSFDLIAEFPQKGDRSITGDDRYLFLETVLSARERLIITYTAFNEKDNTDRPPSPLVSELTDYIRHNCADDTVIDSIIIKHRLQPFSPEYFDGSPPLFSYAAEYLDGARSLFRERTRHRSADESIDLPVGKDLRVIQLRTLIGFFANPYRFFLKNRCGIDFPRHNDVPDDNEPVSIDPYVEKDMIMEMVLRGSADYTGQSALEKRGQLPPLSPGEYELSRIRVSVETVLARMRDRFAADARMTELAVTEEIGGFEFTVHDRVRIVSDREYQSFSPSWKEYDEMCAWISHIFVQAAKGPLRGRIFTDEKMIILKPVEEETARRRFSGFLKLYRSGLFRPLPFFRKYSHEAYKKCVKNHDQSDTEIANTVRGRINPDYAVSEMTNEYVTFFTDNALDLLDERFVQCARIFYDGYSETTEYEYYT
ncbi:MAG: exodeoxyribonuclease V subunit gamma [Spirochaetota bacterium]